MLDHITRHVDAPARVLMAAIFILAGLGKLSATDATVAHMQAYGLPGGLLYPTILFELSCGLLLLIGFGTRFVATLLSVFSVLSAVIFHADFADQTHQVMFLKNLAMAGGLLLLAKHGSTSFSMDALRAKRSSR